jgi:hypothetical protein
MLREFSGETFKDDRVAGEQGRDELRRGRGERRVPRDDRGDHADRLAAHDRVEGHRGVRGLEDLLPGELLGRLEVGVHLAGQERLTGLGEPARRAVLGGDGRGDLVGPRLAQGVDTPDDLLPLLGRGARPGAVVEGLARRGDGRVHVGVAGLGHAAEDGLVMRGKDVELRIRVAGVTQRPPM